MTKTKKDLEVLMDEKRVFEPPKDLVEKSNIKTWMDERKIRSYDELLDKAKDVEWYWGEVAKELDWFKPWDKVLDDTEAPFYKWFTGAKTNIVHNAVDRHMNRWHKNKLAFIWEGETGEVRKMTYRELYMEVNKFANALKSLGVKKGDRITIYLPMLLELPVAMLACAKIGAIHSVVFSGFSAKALRDRINDCEAKVLVTADGFLRRGGTVQLKNNADEALKDAPSIESVVVVKNTNNETSMMTERDVYWDEITAGESMDCKTEEMDPEDTLFILYTSGTTGSPKGIVHVHGGYGVGIYSTLKNVFDIKEEDIYWCTADAGWITGHSYIVYAPLMLGATSFMYEGAPAYPHADRWWQMVEKHGITIIYTAPTAIRAHMRLGDEWPKKCDMSSLRLLGSVGEPINPEAWMWYHKLVGKEKCPIMDTWWQTETGSFMISPVPLTHLKPGTATKPLPGIDADIYSEEGESLTNKGGLLVIKKPWPAMLRTLYKNPDRYGETYWSKYPGIYLAGDVARKDGNGFFWIQGRADDVLNVSGHRIGTAEVESALVAHAAVAEAAAVGMPHEIKGEAIRTYVVLRKDKQPTAELKDELRKWVGAEIGPIARPDEILFVDDLPKTRSGKIMRRVIKAKAKCEPVGDTSTLANPEAVDALDNPK
ncbi:MAG: acetate--CoA ligase [Candidatus Altiarchaeota archaeon]|nr:acetate--CoA ligase [Candidatus Altiarchaeota archaeon]